MGGEPLAGRPLGQRGTTCTEETGPPCATVTELSRHSGLRVSPTLCLLGQPGRALPGQQKAGKVPGSLVDPAAPWPESGTPSRGPARAVRTTGVGRWPTRRVCPQAACPGWGPFSSQPETPHGQFSEHT